MSSGPEPDATALDAINRRFAELRATPVEQSQLLLRWAADLGLPMVATTSFSPFAAVLLHQLMQVAPRTTVLWMDSGYNTPATYRYADELTRLLGLNLHTVLPRRSRAHREAVEGGVPAVDDPRHAAFTRELKLEPFERATAELAPRVWITGVRAEETAERARMRPVSRNPDGLLKVAPLLDWSARQLHEYLKQHGLPNEFDYYDPTKADEHRECGLHLAH